MKLASCNFAAIKKKLCRDYFGIALQQKVSAYQELPGALRESECTHGDQVLKILRKMKK